MWSYDLSNQERFTILDLILSYLGNPNPSRSDQNRIIRVESNILVILVPIWLFPFKVIGDLQNLHI